MPNYIYKMQYEFEAIDDIEAKQKIITLQSANVPVKISLVKHGTSENILKRNTIKMQCHYDDICQNICNHHGIHDKKKDCDTFCVCNCKDAGSTAMVECVEIK